MTVLNILTTLGLTSLGWQLVSALVAYLARRWRGVKWEQFAGKSPVKALLADLCKALGPDIDKAFTMVERYADRKAGNLPACAAPHLPVPRWLLDRLDAMSPEDRQRFWDALQAHMELQPSPSPSPAPAAAA